jgi:hypothetical protein
MKFKEIYCLHCKKNTPNVSPVIVELPNKHYQVRAKCKECGAHKAQFISTKSIMALKGGNVGAIAGAVQGGIGGIADAISKGVKTQHEFNKENGKLQAEKQMNFLQFYRDLEHVRFHDPERVPPSLRLKKFGIDPPNAIFDKKNEAKRERADEALYSYAEKRFFG